MAPFNQSNSKTLLPWSLLTKVLGITAYLSQMSFKNRIKSRIKFPVLNSGLRRTGALSSKLYGDRPLLMSDRNWLWFSGESQLTSSKASDLLTKFTQGAADKLLEKWACTINFGRNAPLWCVNHYDISRFTYRRNQNSLVEMMSKLANFKPWKAILRRLDISQYILYYCAQ